MVETELGRGVELKVGDTPGTLEANFCTLTPLSLKEIYESEAQKFLRGHGSRDIHTVNTEQFHTLLSEIQNCCNNCPLKGDGKNGIGCSGIKKGDKSIIPAVADSSVGMMDKVGWKEKLTQAGASCSQYLK